MKREPSLIAAALALATLLVSSTIVSGEEPGPTSWPTYSPTFYESLSPTTISDNNDPPQQFDAVIVGAGWAGLSATKTLLVDKGISNILVLEANDYIGGRSKTINADGSINVPINKVDDPSTSASNPALLDPIDMGSEWLYEEDNRFKDYLEDKGLLKGVDMEEPNDLFVSPAVSKFYMQTSVNGTTVTRALEEDEKDDLRERVWEGFVDYRWRLLKDGDDMSYADAAKLYREEYLEDQKDIQFLNMVIEGVGAVYTAGDPKKISLREHPPWFRPSFDDPVTYMSVPGVGYGNVAATVGSQFAKNIRLDAKVTAINYEDTSNALITFTNKNGVEHQVAAKTVLVTVPLGVLKAGTIKFTPSLPDWKQERIDKMGFGVMNKCAMQWNDDSAMVWAEEEWTELITQDDSSSGDFTVFMNPTKYKGKPTLVGWIGGDDNVRAGMEMQTDDQVLATVYGNAKAMFPKITTPDRVVVTRWGAEENILGTYSNKVPGRDFYDDAAKLQQRVENVWFAGEATAGEWYATVIGAWETGEEGAVEMAKAIKVWTPAAPPPTPADPDPAAAANSAAASLGCYYWYLTSILCALITNMIV